MTETTNKESEQFPDEEIFRFGTEQFDEVFEDEIRIDSEYGDVRGKYCCLGDRFEKYFKFSSIDGEYKKVKIYCKPGCIKIERMEK
jgi:hypothetical protein